MIIALTISEKNVSLRKKNTIYDTGVRIMRHLTIPEAAERSRMSEAWWRSKVFHKEVEHVKIGRRVFIREQTIDQLFERGLVKPKSKDS